MRKISFWKQYGKKISNAGIVLLVALAVWEKERSGGADSLFREQDLYILIGAVLAMVLLRWFARRHTHKK
ncbi:MAG: hypothetical protein SO362_02435 [Selenomonas montiformis]|nr:hypothetical protein [Selenomonas montiformis]